jgi:aminoglycoside 2'-N-acetyltransferase I
MRVDVRDGPGSRSAVASLFAQVYTDAVLETVPWRNITAAPAERRVVVLSHAGDIVAACGFLARDAFLNDVPVRIGGIGGVMVAPSHQRRGLGRIAMEAAHEAMRSEMEVEFGLLFCEPHNVAFYENLGWRVFSGDVLVEQAGVTIRYDIMQTMTLSCLGDAPDWGRIDLRGLPW